MKSTTRQPTIKVGDIWYVSFGCMDVDKVVIHAITDKTVALYTPLPKGETPKITRYITDAVEWVELIKNG